MPSPPPLSLSILIVLMKFELRQMPWAMSLASSSVKCDDSHWRPAAFLSKSLTPTERNWPIYDKELFAIVCALKEWRHYLVGRESFEVWTDHKNLEFFKCPQTINSRQARWYALLQEFEFSVVYKPGSSNGRADALSRREDLGEGVENPDNKDVVMLPPARFLSQIVIESGLECLLLDQMGCSPVPDGINVI